MHKDYLIILRSVHKAIERHKRVTKFAEIMMEAETAGEELTKEKLTAFAKDAGYEVTMEELQEFFKEREETKEGALSEAELDQVAGGKGGGGFLGIERLFQKGWRNINHIIENPEILLII